MAPPLLFIRLKPYMKSGAKEWFPMSRDKRTNKERRESRCKFQKMQDNGWYVQG